MTISFSRRRLMVGLRRKDFSRAWYGPIDPPADFTTENATPEIGLYSRNTGDATAGDPMHGEITWEPLFDPENFEAKAKKERLEMQKRMLWDAWRYMAEKDTGRIAAIRDQLVNVDPRQRALEKESAQVRKLRSRSGKQRQEESTAPGEVTKSIEDDGSDPDLGYGSGDGDGDDDDDEDDNGDDDARMPPPAVPPFRSERRRSGLCRRAFSEQADPTMGGIRGESLSAESGTSNSGNDFIVDRAASTAGFSSSSVGSRGIRRRREASPDTGRRTRPRTQTPMFMSQSESRNSADHRQGNEVIELDDEDFAGANDGLSDEDALLTALRRSEAPADAPNDSRINGQEFTEDVNAGLDDHEAYRAAMERSMAPEENPGVRSDNPYRSAAPEEGPQVQDDSGYQSTAPDGNPDARDNNGRRSMAPEETPGVRDGNDRHSAAPASPDVRDGTGGINPELRSNP